MEARDIRLQVSLQPAWSKAYKKTQICLPFFHIDKIKRDLLCVAKSSSDNIDNYEFTLQYLNHEKPLRNEDDFYVALTTVGSDNVKPIIINVREKQENISVLRQKQNIDFPKENLEKKDSDIYNGDEKVTCAFCRTSSTVKSAIKDLGPLYGPFKDKNKLFYVHELCALWTPNVYRDPDTNKFMNLAEEVRRCSKIICSHCGKLGGGLGCSQKNCKKTYHFKCALKDNVECRLDDDEFTLLCPEHGKELDGTACEACGKGDDEEKMILCDQCSSGYHLYCLRPPLASVPEGDWFCSTCANKN